MTTEATKGTAAPQTPSGSTDDRKHKRARIIGLDGIRGLLCLSIAITHVTVF